MKIWPTSAGNKIIKVLGGRSNVFLLTNKGSNILIDTSPAFMRKTLERRLERLGVSRIDLLILTHSHFDHVANAAIIREKYIAKVIIHRSEASYLSAGDNILPTGTNPVSKFLVRTFANQFESFAKYHPCNADILVDEMYNLAEYGFNAYLMHTPGHTIGSMSLIVDDEIAIVGDTMFGVFRSSVFPPFAADTEHLINSWNKLLQTKCRLFLPAHGSENDRSLVEKDYNNRRNINAAYLVR